MKRFYYITAAFAISLTLSGCGDGIDLPDLNVETDLNEIPLPDVLEGLEEIALKPETEPMKHAEQGVYALHTEDHFNRIRLNLKLDEDPTVNSEECTWNERLALLRQCI